MATLEFPTFRIDHFEASATWDGSRLSLILVGSAELRVNEDLGPLMARLHAEARRLGAREVMVDMSNLQFMDSSCFKRLITWLNTAKNAPAERYAIRFRSNPDLRWQRASLAALSCFAPELVKVEPAAR